MFMHYALNHHHLHRYRMAADEFGADMNDLPEIEDGLNELEEAAKITGRQGAYWNRIRATILANSSTSDVDDALKEWDRAGNAYQQRGGTCQLCSHHPITFHYPIKNRVTGKQLDVGSECVYNYLEIPGFGSMEELRRRLNGERARLVKLQKGEITQTTMEAFQKAGELSTKLSVQYARLAVGGQDFNLYEYYATLLNLTTMLSGLDPKHSMLAPLQQANMTARKVRSLHEQLKKRSKKVDTLGPVSMVKGAMGVRDDEEKLSLLERIQSDMSDLLKVGDPTDFVNRVTDAITEAKDSLLRQVSETANTKFTGLENYAKPYLDQLRRYPNLRAEYEKAIEGIRLSHQQKADEARQTVAVFMEKISDYGSRWTPLWSVRVYIDSAKNPPQNEGVLTWQNLLRNVQGLLSSDTRYFADYVGEHFLGQKGGVRDTVGVKVAYLRACDEVFSADLGSANWKFQSAIQNKDNQQVIDIIEDEVDDVKQAKKKKLYQFLGERWGVDLQKAFSAFSADNRVDFLFCEGLIENWQRFPKLGPAFMGKIKMKMGENSRPVPNSAWDKLKGELTRTVD